MSTFNNSKNVAFVVSLGDEKDPVQQSLLTCELGSKEQEELGSKLATKYGKYAYILHDRDVKEDGSLKTPHLHIVVTSDKASSASTWIQSLSETIGVKKEAISIEAVRSNIGAIRYLCHKDQPNKTQYEETAICTNVKEYVKQALNSHEVTLEGLKNCATASEYFEYVGKDNYSKYRSAWKDLQEETYHNRAREDEYTRYKEVANKVIEEIGAFLGAERGILNKKTEEKLNRWQSMLVFGPFFFEKN